MESNTRTRFWQDAEKVILARLLKNAQVQGPRNPEEGGVLRCTPQRRRMRETPQMGVFQRPARSVLTERIESPIVIFIAPVAQVDRATDS